MMLPECKSLNEMKKTTSSRFETSSEKSPLKCKVKKSDDSSSYEFIPSDYVIPELLEAPRKLRNRTVKIDFRELSPENEIVPEPMDNWDESARIPKKREKHCCDDCPKKFTLKKDLIQHRKTHEVAPTLPDAAETLPPTIQVKDIKTLKCDSCDKKFRRKYELVAHARTAHKKKQADNFTCHFCEKNFKRKADIIRHISRLHTNNIENNNENSSLPRKNNNKGLLFSCDHCSEKFGRLYLLSRHISREHRRKNFDDEEDEYEIHTCNYCKRVFKKQSDCERHILKLHLEKGDYSDECIRNLKLYCCDVCGLGSQFRSNLVAHRENEHARYDEPTWDKYREMYVMAERCDTCKKYYDRNFTTHDCVIDFDEMYDFSKRVEKEENSYYCEKCGLGFPWKWDLRVHREKHVNHTPYIQEVWDEMEPQKPDFVCEKCRKGFAEVAQMIDHFCAKGKWKEVNIVCDICDQTLPRRRDLLHHKKKYHPLETTSRVKKEPMTCPYCEWQSFSRQFLLDHIKLEHNIEMDSPFACVQCNKIFKRKDTMLIHNMAYHPNNIDEAENNNILSEAQITVNGETAYYCSKCKRIIANSFQFLAHYRYHSIEHRFTCDQCGKQSRTKYQLNKHIDQVHKNLRIYNCDICNKTFNRKQSCIEHRRIHTGERPYQCEKCGKEFIANCALITHRKYHNDFYAHCCPHCPKKFKIRRCLTQHLRTHTGERPFKCELCSKTFNNSSRFSYHKKVTHSENRPFKCVQCGSCFKANKFLQRHMKLHETRTNIQHRRRNNPEYFALISAQGEASTKQRSSALPKIQEAPQFSNKPVSLMKNNSGAGTGSSTSNYRNQSESQRANCSDEEESAEDDTSNYYEPQPENYSVIGKPVTYHDNLMPYNLTHGAQYVFEDAGNLQHRMALSNREHHSIFGKALFESHGVAHPDLKSSRQLSGASKASGNLAIRNAASSSAAAFMVNRLPIQMMYSNLEVSAAPASMNHASNIHHLQSASNAMTTSADIINQATLLHPFPYHHE